MEVTIIAVAVVLAIPMLIAILVSIRETRELVRAQDKENAKFAHVTLPQEEAFDDVDNGSVISRSLTSAWRNPQQRAAEYERTHLERLQREAKEAENASTK